MKCNGRLEFKCYEMHVVIIMVIASYTLKKDQEEGHRLCENTKGSHGPNKVEKHCIRWYGPLLNTAFSKWPSSQINCPPLEQVLRFDHPMSIME